MTADGEEGSQGVQRRLAVCNDQAERAPAPAWSRRSRTDEEEDRGGLPVTKGGI